MKQKPPYPQDRLPVLLSVLDGQIKDLDPQAQYALRLDLAIAILVDSMAKNKTPQDLLLTFHRRAGSLYRKIAKATQQQKKPNLRIVH